VVVGVGGWLSPVSTDSRFLFTENVQFSYVSLRCSSSGQRMRSRHGRKAGEEDGSSITAEFELDVNLEEVTGWSICASLLPSCNLLLLVLHLSFAVVRLSLNTPNCESISCFDLAMVVGLEVGTRFVFVLYP